MTTCDRIRMADEARRLDRAAANHRRKADFHLRNGRGLEGLKRLMTWRGKALRCEQEAATIRRILRMLAK